MMLLLEDGNYLALEDTTYLALEDVVIGSGGNFGTIFLGAIR